MSLMKFFGLIYFFIVPNYVLGSGVVGYAFSQESAKSLYMEHHFFIGERHTVKYQLYGKQFFAEKHIHYRWGKVNPDVVFESHYCKEKYSIKHDSKPGVENALLQVKYSNACEEEDDHKIINVSYPYVVDAGFDHFISQSLEEIRQQSIIFYYPMPSRLDDVELQAESFFCDNLQVELQSMLRRIPKNINNEKQWKHCVLVRPKNWFIAQFSPPTYLAYSSQGRLLMYAGKSNISDANGKYHELAIFYQSP